MSELQKIYERRFRGDVSFRKKMYQVLCGEVFQKYVPPGAVVLDIGAGYCEFINHIEAAEKIAVDLNPDLEKLAGPDVRALIRPSTDLEGIGDGSIDIVFVSNFFEHLSREDITLTIREIQRVLKPGGKALILQPNIRYCSKDYWMFFDHITPLDDRSLSEALEINGLRVVENRPRFLPFTTKIRIPKIPFLIKLYLKFPPAQRIMGQQAFIVAQK